MAQSGTTRQIMDYFHGVFHTAYYYYFEAEERRTYWKKSLWLQKMTGRVYRVKQSHRDSVCRKMKNLIFILENEYGVLKSHETGRKNPPADVKIVMKKIKKQ